MGIIRTCDGQPAENLFVDHALDPRQFFRRHGRKMGEVEPAALLIHIRARLLDMLAQHTAQRRLQKVQRRMVTRNGLPTRAVHGELHAVAHLDPAFAQRADMIVHALGVFLRIPSPQTGPRPRGSRPGQPTCPRLLA